MTITTTGDDLSARLRRWRRLLWSVALVGLIVAAGLSGFDFGRLRGATGRSELPVLGMAPSYTLSNQLGREVASSSLRGKVQIISFLFPYCTTMCPLIAAHMANLENFGLGPAGIRDKVELVSFNLDPEKTGPSQMRAFLSQYGWNPSDPHWQYLVGSGAEIERVVKNGFSVWYKRVSLADEAKDGNEGGIVQPEVANRLAESAHADYDIVHNDVIEVVDQKGRIRKIYHNADTVGWTDLLNLVQSLLAKPA